MADAQAAAAVLPAAVESAIKIVGVLGFILSLSTLGLNLYFRRLDRRRKIKDEFWIQKVIWPKAVEPLVNALDELSLWCAGATSPSADDVAGALTKLQSTLYASDSKVRLLAIFGEDLYNTYQAIREEAEDGVATLLAVASGTADAESAHFGTVHLQSLCGELMKRAVEELVTAQEKL